MILNKDNHYVYFGRPRFLDQEEGLQSRWRAWFIMLWDSRRSRVRFSVGVRASASCKSALATCLRISIIRVNAYAIRKPSHPASQLTGWSAIQPSSSPTGQTTSWPANQLSNQSANKLTTQSAIQPSSSPISQSSSWPANELSSQPANQQLSQSDIQPSSSQTAAPRAPRVKNERIPGHWDTGRAP